MVQGICQFGLEGPMLGVQFAQMRLKTHAILPGGYVNDSMMTQTWGLVEPLPTA